MTGETEVFSYKKQYDYAGKNDFFQLLFKEMPFAFIGEKFFEEKRTPEEYIQCITNILNEGFKLKGYKE